MEWGFIWLMLVLKIPIIALLWIVWWAVHAVDEPAASADEGGGPPVAQGAPSDDPDDPRPPAFPRARGPHGEPAPPPPPRVRTNVTRPRVTLD